VNMALSQTSSNDAEKSATGSEGEGGVGLGQNQPEKEILSRGNKRPVTLTDKGMEWSKGHNDREERANKRRRTTTKGTRSSNSSNIEHHLLPQSISQHQFSQKRSKHTSTHHRHSSSHNYPPITRQLTSRGQRYHNH
jgi:hypothetical protein